MAFASLTNCADVHQEQFTSSDSTGSSLLFQSADASEKTEVFSKYCGACRVLPLVEICCQSVSQTSGADEVSRWWAGVVIVARSWLTGDKIPSESVFVIVDDFPKVLKNESYPLAECVYSAYRARRLADSGCGQHDSVLLLCNKSSELLNQSMTETTITGQHSVTHDVQLLVCDWLLTTRMNVWHDKCIKAERDTLSMEDVAAFQNDLASLRKLACTIKPAITRVFLHEATLRIMTGASPERTLQLYERNLRSYRHNLTLLPNFPVCGVEDLSANTTAGVSATQAIFHCHSSARDRATAALMACKHLPHHLVLTNQPSALLEDAMCTYEKLGDQRSLTSCRQLMARFIVSAPIGC